MTESYLLLTYLMSGMPPLRIYRTGPAGSQREKKTHSNPYERFFACHRCSFWRSTSSASSAALALAWAAAMSA